MTEGESAMDYDENEIRCRTRNTGLLESGTTVQYTSKNGFSYLRLRSGIETRCMTECCLRVKSEMAA